jgi:hypothetical protein
MGMRGRRRIALVVVALWALSSPPARAQDGPDKMACIAADTEGQSLRMDGHLRQARERLRVCAGPTCPKVVREDCQERIAEIDRVEPRVIFEATNGSGKPLRAVEVLVDGKVVASRLDGQPLALDPGRHLFTFRAVGRVPFETTLVLEEGDNDRHAVVLRTGAAGKTDEDARLDPSPPGESRARATDAATSAPASSAASRSETVSLLDASPAGRQRALVAGGAGLIGALVGTIYGVSAIATWSDAQRDCGARCPAGSAGQREASLAESYGTASTIAFVMGGAGLLTGAVLWFTAPVPAPSRVGIGVTPLAGAPQLVVDGKF